MHTIRAFNRCLLSTLFTSCAIMVLIIGSVYAQSVKPRPTNQSPAPAQQNKTLTPENLEKESYQLWFVCFQAWKQGKKPDVPNLGIYDTVDPKEAQRARAVWERSKFRAFLAVAEKAMYQECLNWWRAKEQGQQMTAPILKYPDVFDEAQVKRIEAVWQQAYDKAHLVVFEQGAYQTWLDYYQAFQQGGQPPLPELSITDRVNPQEATKVQEVWTRAQARAQRKTQQSGQALAQQAKQPSIQANNVEALSDGKMTDSLPDVVVDDYTRQTASRSIVPLLDATPPRNTNPQPLSGFNQPRGIAGVFSYAANSTQPSQMQPNSPEVIVANNNRMIAELNAETTKAKTAVNTATAKQLVEKQDSRNGQTNINPAVSSGRQVVRRYAYGSQGPISMSQLINGQWVTSYFIYDGQGNVRALTDEHGNVTDTYDYDAFGNLINKTGNTPNNRLYAGEEYDPDLGLYYNRSRYLNVGTGRFFTMDSFEGYQTDPLSLHKYVYANNNPTNTIDPTGHFGENLSAITIQSVTAITAVLQKGSIINSVAKSLGERCWPSFNELTHSRTVLTELEQAWKDSKPGTGINSRHEEGGWIYNDDIGLRIITQRAPSGFINSIDLDAPPNKPGFTLIAIYHTHPTLMGQLPKLDPEPSITDVRYAFFRGVTGLVYTQIGIKEFGPDRRGYRPDLALPPSLVNPYPGNSADTTKCPPPY